MKTMTKKYLSNILILISILSCNVSATSILNDRLDLNCDQSGSTIIACSYRPLQDEKITSITARVLGNNLEINTNITYPANDSVTAIMFLVDTSDPGRQDVISKNAEQIRHILDTSEPHHIVGLASFDKDLNVRVPLGKNNSQVKAASSNLIATGLTTELYRNIIKAIELLGRTNADRKVLYLFSDGQAEDKAYFHEDVINVSRTQGVVINSLGYPRSTALSVALQTLRRLSEETGGVYIEADQNFNIPTSFINKPFLNIDRGGHFLVDLASVDNNSSSGSPSLELKFNSAGGVIALQIPVALQRLTPSVLPPATVTLPLSLPVPVPVPTQPVTAVQTQEPGYVEYLLWYGVPAALVVLILLTLFSVFLLFRKQKTDEAPARVVYADVKPLAYLITQDEKSKTYPVTSSTWRIGRSRDNEMTLPDNSISRRHAEIQRESDGKFVLYDRESSNGVYINNKKIVKHTLSEGDILEIGDIFLRFTQYPLDYQFADDTAMMNTRAPDFH